MVCSPETYAPRGAKLAVAMSGGVDSSLAAWLLGRQGVELVGLSLRLAQGPEQSWRDGARAAAELGLEHHVVEAAGAFERLVVGPSARAYSAGLTPNPCVVCNARLKLPLLWRAARRLGCHALATGHYARLERGPQGPVLAEAADQTKSQAYFLARVAPELLAKLVFPLAGMTKEQVRAKARELGLAAARRPESQDACFLPPGGWDELVAQRGLVRPGAVEDGQGRVLGSHRALHLFTVGQRRGLGLALGKPVYVTGLDGRRAVVRVGPREELEAAGLVGRGLRWRLPPEGGRGLNVRLRYSQRPVGCRVRSVGPGAEVVFDRPQRAVAPGQLAVFSRGGRVAGSAWIKGALNQS